MKGLEIGCIVHFVSPITGDHLAAIVTAVAQTTRATVYLHVFYPIHPTQQYVQMMEESIQYNEGCSPGTWHWPERA